MRRAVLTLFAASIVAAACARRSVVVVHETAPPRASAAVTLGIPPGHLPPPGRCRIWIPGRPPGHQPPPGPCARLAHHVPAGAWLVYRPSKDKKRVKVTVYHARKPDTVVVVRFYDVKTGKLLQEERPSSGR